MRFETLASVVLLLALAACGSSPDDDPMTPASESTSSVLGAPTPASVDEDSLGKATLEKWILANFGGDGKVGYQSSEFDLDGDGTPEILAYIGGPSMCGSGGCSLVILKQQNGSLAKVLETSVTQLPLGVLDSATNGWRDIWVTVAGGGILTGRRILRFDGRTYPTNPTVPPAEELKILDAQVLIEQGDLLWLN